MKQSKKMSVKKLTKNQLKKAIGGSANAGLAYENASNRGCYCVGSKVTSGSISPVEVAKPAAISPTTSVIKPAGSR